MGTELPFEYELTIGGVRADYISRRRGETDADFLARMVSDTISFGRSVEPLPSSITHTMHIDHYGKVTYNDLPDKVKAPQVYG